MKSTWVLIVIGTVAAVSVAFSGCGSDDGVIVILPLFVVTVIDGGHVDVTFRETVDKGTAERSDNYIIVERAPTPSAGGGTDTGLELAAPGDTVWVGNAALKADGKTVGLSTQSTMNNAPYDIKVSGVRDASGNEMTSTEPTKFAGTNAPDITPPDIVSRTPGPGGTGVGIGQSVAVEFSESMDENSVATAFSWTWASGIIGFKANRGNDNAIVFTPVGKLLTNTEYTVSLSNSATDPAGNPLAPTTWTFRTMMTADTVRPTFVSSFPANGSVNVATDIEFRLTFSEPIDPNSFNDDLAEIYTVPEPPDGILTWTDGGATLNYEPFSPLLDDQQYTVTIPEGAVADFAGNRLDGSTVITFTTGANLPTGRITGTVAGDATSLDAMDPTGAFVIVPTNDFIDDGDPEVNGAAVAGSGGVYSVDNLANGWYYPAAFFESNGDGILDLGLGDAFGVYGVDVANLDFTVDSVQVVGGGTVPNINFPLYDPIAIGGSVVYIGSAHNVAVTTNYYVGIFDTTGFDVSLEPDFGTDDLSIVDDPGFNVSEFDDGLVDGTYYVGAYLDVNSNGVYDELTDPAGFYDDSSGNPIPVTVTDGRDVIGFILEMEDVAVPAFTWPAGWQGRSQSRALSGDAEAARRYHQFVLEMFARYERSP